MNIYKPLLGIFILLILLFAIIQCSTKKQLSTSTKILTGWLTENYLFKEIPPYKEENKSYQPNENVITQLNSLDKNFHVLIFLGTYCSDCKREVPRFLKIVEKLNKNFSYKLFGLNRAKLDTSDMREKYNIEYVPTFIVYHNEKEIGRIIERPMISLESDLLGICTSF